MAYLVLARKYRPTTFADLVGQEHIVRTLANAIALNRVHHAFLFTGARGVGKTTTARIMARALNCAQGPTSTPCGVCGPCTEILAGKSSDVLEIDGASNTGVDSVRELRDNVRYMPSGGRHKLYIIDEVHMLSTAAFNALLKTLEEPPPHVKFIFATTEPHKIPVTILSRCQRFDFRRVSGPSLTQHLRGILEQEKMPLGHGALAAVVREAQGSVRDALSLLDQVLSYGSATDSAVLEALGVVDAESVSEVVDALLSRDAKKLLDKIFKLDNSGHDLAQVASLLAEHLRDVAVTKHLAEPHAGLIERSATEMEALRAQAALRSHSDLQGLFREALQVAEDVGRSSMPRVSLEMGLLRLFEMAPKADLKALLQRLDALGGGATVEPPQGGAAPALRAPPPSAKAGPPPPRSEAPPPKAVELPQVAPAAAEGDACDHEAWRRFVDRVRSLRPAIASVLEHGRLLAFSKTKVELAYPPSTFYWDAARDADNQILLNATLEEQFGQPTRLMVVALKPDMTGGQSLAEANARQRQGYETGVKKGALEHPAVQNAVAILGAEVTEVKALMDGA